MQRGRRIARGVWLSVVALAGCSAHSPTVAHRAVGRDAPGATAIAAPAPTPTPTPAPTPTPPPKPPAAKACPVVTIDIPALTHVTKHDVGIPDVVDFGDGMDAFFEKLARLARQTPGQSPGLTVRIGVYGDSNMANDRTTGDIRRRLQAMWGDSGHGWVAFGKPWGWYHHMDLQHGTTGTWISYNLSNTRALDAYYGFAGVAAESTEAGATAWVETAKAGAPVGTRVSSFDLFYLARPKGGSFDVAIDGASREVVDSNATTTEVRFLHYQVDDGPHHLTVTVKKGRVRVYGVALERDTPGIIVDGLGVGSLNAKLLDDMDHPAAEAGLTRRGYDLIIETTGSNMWVPKGHPIWMASLVATWRAALPHVAIMLWSPPDMVHKGTWKSEPRMRAVTKEKHDIAETNKVAFWDLYTALGGFGSIPLWLKDGWAEPDGLHLGPGLNQYIGERFVHAVLVELARRLDKDPRLGCGDAP